MVGFPPWSSSHKHLEGDEAESAARPLMEPVPHRRTCSTWVASLLMTKQAKTKGSTWKTKVHCLFCF